MAEELDIGRTHHPAIHDPHPIGFPKEFLYLPDNRLDGFRIVFVAIKDSTSNGNPLFADAQDQYTLVDNPDGDQRSMPVGPVGSWLLLPRNTWTAHQTGAYCMDFEWFSKTFFQMLFDCILVHSKPVESDKETVVVNAVITYTQKIG